MGLQSPMVMILLISSTAAQTVDFFYTDTIDLCSYKGTSMQANEQTTHGGVCAYRPDTSSIYGCPAPDPKCWTWYQDCNDSGTGQTTCNRDGSVWCCNAVAGETCTTSEGQINICVSNFTSPNSGVSIDTANSVYLAALDVSNVTATSQSSDPTPFSTRNLAAATSSSSSSSSSASTGTASATTTASDAPTGSAATSTSLANSSVSSSSSGISGGAIAGIVIGAIAVIAIIGGIFFWLGKRRRNNKQVNAAETRPLNSGSEMPHQGNLPAYNAMNEKTRYGGPAEPVPSEMGNDGHGRAEMPNTSYNGQPPSRYEMA